MGNVVPFPATLTAQQRQQQILFHRHVVVFSVFLLRPSPENEAEARNTHRKWITAFLGDGESAEEIHKSFLNRLACMRQGTAA